MAAAKAIGRLNPHCAYDALPPVPLIPKDGSGLAIGHVGEVLFGSGAIWLLSLGGVDAAKADLLLLLSCSQAGEGIAVGYANYCAF